MTLIYGTGGIMLTTLAIILAVYAAAGVAISASPLARHAIRREFWLNGPSVRPLRMKLAIAFAHVGMALAWPALLPGAAANPFSQEPVRLRRALALAAKSYRTGQGHH